MSTEKLRAIRRVNKLWKTVKNGQITDAYKRVQKTVKNMIWKAKRFLRRSWHVNVRPVGGPSLLV